MRIFPPCLAAALLAVAFAPAIASAQAPPAAPLRGANCLDPDFARGWVYLDDRNLLVDAGRFRYHVELNATCTGLAWSPFINFRGDQISGRVCGRGFDAVITRDHTCTVRRMSLITKEQYKALEDEHSRKGRKGRRAVPRAYD